MPKYLTEALRQAYPGIVIGIDEPGVECKIVGQTIAFWNRVEAKPDEAAVVAAYDPKPAAAEVKREEIYREQEIRSATVYGKEVDRHFFAWVEELYADVIKAAARNPIDANTPITNGLRLLRDNRNTLLNGLDAWVDDPAKTAEDIAGFDVVGWSGWSVARP